MPLIGTIMWFGFLFAGANEKEKQEGSALVHRYKSHLLRKAPVYKGLYNFCKKDKSGFL
ncbi:hypothetical protein GCM10022395_09970 [Snuella lapsa]|uniref:Uncharacterized protein n=1 Tax=Snuella lapsa TaxID=870481 RepID=A0ABP6X4I0_9FLAO